MGYKFYSSKCQVLHITKLKTPIPSKYFLHNTEGEKMSFGVSPVNYSDSEPESVSAPNTDLSWGKRIDNITKKANQTLGFVKRNTKVHNQDLKSTAYKTLIQLCAPA